MAALAVWKDRLSRGMKYSTKYGTAITVAPFVCDVPLMIVVINVQRIIDFPRKAGFTHLCQPIEINEKENNTKAINPEP